MTRRARILVGDVRQRLADLPAASVHCAVTSPPYWGLRDYRAEGQIGIEPTLDGFLQTMVEVFEAVARVLRPDGTLWLNLGDSYAGNTGGDPYSGFNSRYKGTPGPGKQAATNGAYPSGRQAVRKGVRLGAKNLLGVPWRVAFALQEAGWILRSDVVWHKPNPLPESVEDRPTKAHEYVFLMTRRRRYFYDAHAVRRPYAGPTLAHLGRSTIADGAVKEYPPGVQRPMAVMRSVVEGLERRGGANLRSVWTIPTQPFAGAHFATFPEELARRCILAGTSAHGVCAACGAPFVRRVEPTAEYASRLGLTSPHTNDLARGRTNRGSGARDQGGLTAAYVTTGWRAGCSCGADPVPATVLDPFAGAGTTGVVALGLGRDFVGTEINAEYAAMAAARIRASAPLLNRCQVVGAGEVPA